MRVTEDREGRRVWLTTNEVRLVMTSEDFRARVEAYARTTPTPLALGTVALVVDALARVVARVEGTARHVR